MSPAESNSSAEQKPASRRSYLGWLMGLCTAGVGAVLSAPLIRFTLYPLRIQTTEIKWSDAGAVSDFASMTTPVQRSITVEQIDGWRKAVSEKVVYVSKSSTGQFEVLSAVCPHLGCSVQWRDAKHGFECPCHASRIRPTARDWAARLLVVWTHSKLRSRTGVLWSAINISVS